MRKEKGFEKITFTQYLCWTYNHWNMDFSSINEADPLISVCIIGLYVVSYVMERMGVDTFYWAALTILLLIISLWTMAPRLFLQPKTKIICLFVKNCT